MTQTGYQAPVERAQESTEQLAISKLSFNHPKNYFGVPFAIAASGDTGHLISGHLVSMCGRAREGARTLGLIDRDANLTSLGETVVRRRTTDRAPVDVLENLEELKGSTSRFIAATDNIWTTIAREVVLQYEDAASVLSLLATRGEETLPRLTNSLITQMPEVAESFVTADTVETVNDTPSVQVRHRILSDPSVYRGTATYQFKSLLYHCGLLTERGSDTSSLVPKQDCWKLEPAVRSQVERRVDR